MKNMSKNKKCDKCNGEGGILWITSTGVDAIWEFCDRCNGTGEIEKKEKGDSC
jgi:DnaJ-class molecular chaperone